MPLQKLKVPKGATEVTVQITNVSMRVSGALYLNDDLVPEFAKNAEKLEVTFDFTDPDQIQVLVLPTAKANMIFKLKITSNKGPVKEIDCSAPSGKHYNQIFLLSEADQ